MATTPWSIPTGKAITGATYIKDTDDNISATLEDLVDWCNNTNGTYNDYTLTGLRTDFVDLQTAQTITAVKTVDTLGAIDFTGGELRIGGTSVTSTATELNVLDGISPTLTATELSILDGVTSTAAEINVLDGIPATLTATELGYVDGVTSSIQTQIDGKASLTGATFTGQAKGITPVSAEDLARKDYVDSGDIGTNQTWQNLTASRTFGVTYTNTSGKPIMVQATNSLGAGIYNHMYVAGVPVSQNSLPGTESWIITSSAIVPNGQTYKVECNGTMEKWYELR